MHDPPGLCQIYDPPPPLTPNEPRIYVYDSSRVRYLSLMNKQAP